MRRLIVFPRGFVFDHKASLFRNVTAITVKDMVLQMFGWIWACLIVRARPWAIMRPLLFALVCTTSLSARDHASARGYAPRDVGDWTVTASKDGKGCFLTQTYERPGDTTVLLGLDIDGTNRLSVLNANWSIKSKDRLTLNFRLSNSSYPAHFAVGIVSNGKQGFVTSFGAKFPSYFATSKDLQISRGDVPVERLDLEKIDAAVALLRKCVDDQSGEPADAAGGKTHSDDIPVDPFASAPKRESKK